MEIELSVVLQTVLIGVLTGFLSEFLFQKGHLLWKWGAGVLTAGVAVIVLIYYPFITLMFAVNGYMSALMLTEGKEKYEELKEKVRHPALEKIELKRTASRVLVDIVITLVVSSGMILFVIFQPAEYSVLTIMIVFYLINIFTNLISRMITFYTTRLYFDREQERLLIVSRLASKELPLNDLKGMRLESSPDFLKLHPLFVFFTTNKDFTVNLNQVLCLLFPGENIYLTVEDVHEWKARFESFAQETDPEQEQEKRVLPVWHPKVLRRLIGKAYFAVTVKGISAYTGLVLLLYWLEAPYWVIIPAILVWWMFNLWISDRILTVALDAEEITAGEAYEAAQQVFHKAGLQRVRLFVTETPLYNALAAGMNVGRSMVTLTSATLQLPTHVLQGILAHEAVHVQKRDVLVGQVLKMMFLAVLIILVLVFENKLQTLAREMGWVLIPVIMVVMWFFPVFLSFVGQWMEVRADHLGSRYVPGGSRQMEEALRQLTQHQDQETDRSISYQLPESKKNSAEASSELDRPEWYWRLLEFTIQIHPPMYWRVAALKSHTQGWGRTIWKKWLKDRFTEPFPDRIREKVRRMLRWH